MSIYKSCNGDMNEAVHCGNNKFVSLLIKTNFASELIAEKISHCKKKILKCLLKGLTYSFLIIIFFFHVTMTYWFQISYLFRSKLYPCRSRGSCALTVAQSTIYYCIDLIEWERRWKWFLENRDSERCRWWWTNQNCKDGLQAHPCFPRLCPSW